MESGRQNGIGSSMNAQRQFTHVLRFKVAGYHGANELPRLTDILLPSLYKFLDTVAWLFAQLQHCLRPDGPARNVVASDNRLSC